MSRPDEAQLRRLGASLREIDPTKLNQDDDGSAVRWFLGDAGAELFAWARSGAAPHHVQLVFAGVTVDWDEHHGLATGAFEKGAAVAGGRYDPYLMHVAATADPDVCRAALALVRAGSPALTEVAAPLVAALEGVLAV